MNEEKIVRLTDENIQRSRRYYGGASCGKLGILWENECYLLKFPGNLRETNIKNADTSYTNSSFSEYIGSKIYELLDIDVHKTFLAEYQGKIVVCCKDFLKSYERLWEFSQLKTSMPVLAQDGDILTGNSTDLHETLSVLEKHPDLQNLRDRLEERFWEMFIVDALIGNPDRNNGNWGVISDGYDMRLAPVYDNGSAFHFRRSDRQLETVLESGAAIRTEAYKGRVCVFEENGKKINPYKLILSASNTKCNEALTRIFPRIDQGEIERMIEETPAISELRADFCKAMIDCRIKEVLEPAYKTVLDTTLQQSAFKRRMCEKRLNDIEDELEI